MIEKLEQLTIGQFIDLVCGDMSVLADTEEQQSQTRFALVMRNIVLEYRKIADPAGVKIYLSELEELIKAKLGVAVFGMCKNLVKLGAYDRCREVLVECGINAARMSDKRLEAEVKSRYQRASKTVLRIEDENKDIHAEKEDIRRQFDEQTAALMTHFKFQIDTCTMKASIYAHLVARYNREVKAMIVASRKK